MAKLETFSDLLRVPSIRLGSQHEWITRVGKNWNVYKEVCEDMWEPFPSSYVRLVVSTPDESEAITAFVKAAGIKKEDVQDG